MLTSPLPRTPKPICGSTNMNVRVPTKCSNLAQGKVRAARSSMERWLVYERVLLYDVGNVPIKPLKTGLIPG